MYKKSILSIVKYSEHSIAKKMFKNTCIFNMIAKHIDLTYSMFIN